MKCWILFLVHNHSYSNIMGISIMISIDATSFCFLSSLEMPVTIPEVYIVFCCLLSNTKMITENCNFHGIQKVEEGQACEHKEYRNIIVSERCHCILTCIHSKECKTAAHSACLCLYRVCYWGLVQAMSTKPFNINVPNGPPALTTPMATGSTSRVSYLTLVGDLSAMNLWWVK